MSLLRVGATATRWDRNEGFGPTETDGLVTSKPGEHPPVGFQEAVITDAKDRGAQLRQDLVDACRVIEDDRVEADERVDDFGLDEDRVAVAVERAAGDEGPAEIRCDETPHNCGLHRRFFDVAHAPPSRNRSWEPGIFSLPANSCSRRDERY